MANLQLILHVDDIRAALRVYCDELGMSEQWVYREGDEGPPQMAAIAFENITFMLSSANGAAGTPADRGNGVVFYLYTERDLDVFFEQLKARPGLVVLEAPADREWEDRTFTIKDPTGYVFAFARTLNEPVTSAV